MQTCLHMSNERSIAVAVIAEGTVEILVTKSVSEIETVQPLVLKSLFQVLALASS